MKGLKSISKKIGISGLLMVFLAVSGCNSEDAPECFQAPGEIVKKDLSLEPFNRVVVYGKVKLFIEQGADQKVSVEAGENLIGKISAEVEAGELRLRDRNSCDFFRTPYVPVVHVTVPNLNYIENAGNQMIEGVGELNFPQISLRSNNYDKDPTVYTNGDFKLNLVANSIAVSGDDFSNFYLTGRTGYLLAQFWAGDGRLDARNLIAENIQIFHRGTNKMILNPQQSLKGEIRSTGDVISVNRPAVVEVQSFYTGKLIFE